MEDDDDDQDMDAVPLLDAQLMPLEVFRNSTFELNLKGIAIPVLARMFFPIPQLIMVWPAYKQWKELPEPIEFVLHYTKMLNDRDMVNGAAVPLIVTTSIIAYLLSGTYRKEVSLCEVLLPWWFSLGGVVVAAVPHILASRNRDRSMLNNLRRRRIALRIAKLLGAPLDVTNRLADCDVANLDQVLRETTVTTKYVWTRERLRSVDIDHFQAVTVSLSAYLDILVPSQSSDPGFWNYKKMVSMLGSDPRRMCSIYKKLLFEVDVYNATASTTLFMRILSSLESTDVEFEIKGQTGVDGPKKISAAALADKFLVGRASISTESAIMKGLKYMRLFASFILLLFLGILPSLVRPTSHPVAIPRHLLTKWIAAVYIIWGCFNYIVLCFVVWPLGLQSLFTVMLHNFKALNSMLDGTSGGSLPAVDAGDIQQLRVCSDIRRLFVTACRGQKVLLEANLGFILVTLGLLFVMTGYSIVREGTPFNSDLLCMIAWALLLLVLMSALPAILIGFEVGRAARTTEKLLKQQSVLPQKLGMDHI